MGQHDRALRSADTTLEEVRQDVQRISGGLTALQAERGGLVARSQTVEDELGSLREEIGRHFATFWDPRAELV